MKCQKDQSNYIHSSFKRWSLEKDVLMHICGYSFQGGDGGSKTMESLSNGQAIVREISQASLFPSSYAIYMDKMAAGAKNKLGPHGLLSVNRY